MNTRNRMFKIAQIGRGGYAGLPEQVRTVLASAAAEANGHVVQAESASSTAPARR